MCFVLYIATQKPLPIVLWDDQTRGIHTAELSEHDGSIRTHFRNTHVYYIGSDTHCGCGLRNASYQNGCWPEEEWRPEDDRSHLEAQPNHERLVEFIRKHLPEETSFELYGMWEADYSAPPLSDQSIPLKRLLELDFYFRDRGHYLVSIDSGEPHGSTAILGMDYGIQCIAVDEKRIVKNVNAFLANLQYQKLYKWEDNSIQPPDRTFRISHDYCQFIKTPPRWYFDLRPNVDLDGKGRFPDHLDCSWTLFTHKPFPETYSVDDHATLNSFFLQLVGLLGFPTRVIHSYEKGEDRL